MRKDKLIQHIIYILFSCSLHDSVVALEHVFDCLSKISMFLLST